MSCSVTLLHLAHHLSDASQTSSLSRRLLHSISHTNELPFSLGIVQNGQ